MIDKIANKTRYIQLIRSIQRDGFDAEGLIKYLENSDFFEAPASTVYHNAVEGGLCDHSLHVYDNLIALIRIKYDAAGVPSPYSEDTIKLVALGHDFGKINFYEQYFKNEKHYMTDMEGGIPERMKHDNNGYFEWQSVSAYKVKDAKSRYLFGTHGQNGERLLSFYAPLTEEESCAIVNHHFGLDDKTTNMDLSPIANKYNLLPLLFTADVLSTYVDERIV